VAHKKTSPIHKAYTDSLKKAPYPYRLPILGEKLRKMGFDLPLPNGLMVNYIISSQDITLTNLSVGLDPDNLTNVDGLARFESIKPLSNVINLRYDFWLLPFLDVYALGGFAKTATEVKLALPFSANFTAHGEGPMVGWGIAAGAGMGPLFLSTDYNMVWTFMPQLSAPALARAFDIRIGHVFHFPKRLQSNISVMVGAQWLKLSPYSLGKLDVSEKLGITPEKKEKALDELNNWYNGLPPNLQDDFSGFYDAMEGWLSNENDTYLYYEFNKSLAYPWSMTVGLNYQVNHRHTFAAIYTFLGSREQLVLSYNYRFGFKGKTLLSGVEF
jgi:hypothetical protein